MIYSKYENRSYNMDFLLYLSKVDVTIAAWIKTKVPLNYNTVTSDTVPWRMFCRKMHTGEYLQIFNSTEKKKPMSDKGIGQGSVKVRKILEFSYSDAN